MGEKDGFAFDNTLNHLQIMNANSRNKNNAVAVINNAGHSFKDRGQELAKTILNFIKE